MALKKLTSSEMNEIIESWMKDCRLQEKIVKAAWRWDCGLVPWRLPEKVQTELCVRREDTHFRRREVLPAVAQG